MDFETRYNEEEYLFDIIGPRFREQGWLNADDLFAIVRWKANRAISKVAKLLVRVSGKSLDEAARELTSDLASAASARDRFYILSEKWNLRLPMASAILTVLYPDDFTVYDVRACEMLGDFEKLAYRTGTETYGYSSSRAPEPMSAPHGPRIRSNMLAANTTSERGLGKGGLGRWSGRAARTGARTC